MNKIKLVEGTHYRRRFYQPQPPPHKCRELVSCLFCDTSSYPDDEEHVAERVGRTKRCKGVLRLDKLTSHIKDKHPECIPAEGRSLLDMGFTTTRADDGPNGPESTLVDDDPMGPPDPSPDAIDNPNLSLGVVSRDTSATLQVPVATAERGVGLGQEFWRSLTRSLDGVIKSNSTAQVIPSAEAIAAEVLRQQQQHRTEQQGTGVSRENV
jgi:hypothetical protein